MADTASLIALGAAIGGVAGKIAEKSWESALKWLTERFGSHSAAARRQAKINAAQFVKKLAKNLDDTERVGTNLKAILKSAAHPQFSIVLQAAIIGAAQTDEDAKHDLLAKLVANRLLSPTESTYALASQLAVEAICLSTKKQLTLMALACFLEEIRPRDVASVCAYLEWLDFWLGKFRRYDFVEIDAKHLVAIACVTYDRASNRSLEMLLQMKGGITCLEAEVMGRATVQKLAIDWSEGLAGVSLTSVGSIIGGLALNNIVGIDSGLPGWSKKCP